MNTVPTAVIVSEILPYLSAQDICQKTKPLSKTWHDMASSASLWQTLNVLHMSLGGTEEQYHRRHLQQREQTQEQEQKAIKFQSEVLRVVYGITGACIFLFYLPMMGCLQLNLDLGQVIAPVFFWTRSLLLHYAGLMLFQLRTYTCRRDFFWTFHVVAAGPLLALSLGLEFVLSFSSTSGFGLMFASFLLFLSIHYDSSLHLVVLSLGSNGIALFYCFQPYQQTFDNEIYSPLVCASTLVLFHLWLWRIYATSSYGYQKPPLMSLTLCWMQVLSCGTLDIPHCLLLWDYWIWLSGIVSSSSSALNSRSRNSCT